MALKSEGKDLYPIEVPLIYIENQKVYDRSERQKNYFYLAFVS